MSRDWIDQPAIAERAHLDPQAIPQSPTSDHEARLAEIEELRRKRIAERQARGRELTLDR
jgi:hypothetical protein